MTFPTLRDYQHRAVCAVAREVGLGNAPGYRQSTLVLQATGTGKTPIIGAIARLHLRRGGRRVLITAPREELLAHSHDWTHRWLPSLSKAAWGWEMRKERAHEGTRIVLGSLATLRQPRRLEQMPAPDLILHDEGHLDLAMLDKIGKALPKAKRVGLTATPDRSDLQAILPDPFEAVHPDAIYEIGDAIRDGNLSPIEGRRVLIHGLELQRAAVANGDFKPKSLSAIMRQEPIVDQTAKVALEETEDRPTLLFCCDLAHARALQARLEAWAPGTARVASGQLARGDRRDVLRDFTAGRFRFLLTVVLLTYGWDCPPASCAIMARPTKSRALWTQAIGRVLRLFPGKKTALVLDLWGGTSELSLVTPEAALEPQFRDLEDQETAFAGWAEEPGAEEAVLQDLTATDDEVRVLSSPPEKAYRVVEVANQLGCLDYQLDRRGLEEPSAHFAQVVQLEALGVDHADYLSERQADELLEHLTDRERRGLCSLKMAKLLQRNGLNPMVSFEKASWAIGLIRANQWKVPAVVRADPELRVTGRRAVVTGRRRR